MKLVNEDLTKEQQVETSMPDTIMLSELITTLEELPEGVLFILESEKDHASLLRLSCFSRGTSDFGECVLGEIKLGNYSFPVVMDKSVYFPQEAFYERALKAIYKYQTQQRRTK